jgi:hypothetical protein
MYDHFDQAVMENEPGAGIPPSCCRTHLMPIDSCNVTFHGLDQRFRYRSQGNCMTNNSSYHLWCDDYENG